MLKFIKDLFGGSQSSGPKIYSPPPGTDVHDRNFGATIVAAKEGGYTGISIKGAKLTEKGIRKLATFPGLKQLKLDSCGLDDTSMVALKGVGGLERLELPNNKLAGACFVKIGKLPNLTYLNLSGCPIVDMTLIALHQNCPKLEELDLSGSKITDQAIDYIGNMRLKKVHVKNVSLDGAALAMLTHGNESLKIVD